MTSLFNVVSKSRLKRRNTRDWFQEISFLVLVAAEAAPGKNFVSCVGESFENFES